ncbi:hypothetical protein KSF73_06540 [Burkholderiaceae bacterium DAT-1]|nr:hypothetical protein [Burkholderiaceae bacterium DAT-1]
MTESFVLMFGMLAVCVILAYGVALLANRMCARLVLNPWHGVSIGAFVGWLGGTVACFVWSAGGLSVVAIGLALALLLAWVGTWLAPRWALTHAAPPDFVKAATIAIHTDDLEEDEFVQAARQQLRNKRH